MKHCSKCIVCDEVLPDSWKEEDNPIPETIMDFDSGECNSKIINRRFLIEKLFTMFNSFFDWFKIIAYLIGILFLVPTLINFLYHLINEVILGQMPFQQLMNNIHQYTYAPVLDFYQEKLEFSLNILSGNGQGG